MNTNIFQQAEKAETALGQYRILAKTAGVRASRLHFGGMSVGQNWGEQVSAGDKPAAFKLLDAYVQAGGNVIDTSPNYHQGQSECWIGEWLSARRNREDLVLSTKFGAKYRCDDNQPHPNSAGLHRHNLRTSLASSLQRLQTTYVDILYAHWWDWSTSIEELMDSLHVVVEQGLVHYLGISNAPAWVVSAANTYARMAHKTPFSVYQGRWSVLQRDIEVEILPMARQFGMAIVPYGSLGGGRLKMVKTDAEVRALMGTPTQTNEEHNTAVSLQAVADEQRISSGTTVALAWMLAQGVDVFPVVGARSEDQLKQSIAALSLELTAPQCERIQAKVSQKYPYDIIGQDPHTTGVTPALLAATGNISFASNYKEQCLVARRPVTYE